MTRQDYQVWRQESFNTVWNGLASQGFEQSVNEYSCAYRGNDGRKCAAGWLLPDEEFKPAYNNRRSCFIPYFAAMGEAKQNFIAQLQDCHDHADSPEDVQKRLRRLAASWNLSIPKED